MITIDTRTHRVIRGARPKSFEELLGLNVKSVINLEQGWFEFLHGRNFQEDQWAEKAGINLHHRPMSDFTEPRPSDLLTTVRLIRQTCDYGDVYFHCLHGVDRTGLVAAAYRIKVQGWRFQNAVDEMLKLGYHQFPYGHWIDVLKRLP